MQGLGRGAAGIHPLCTSIFFGRLRPQSLEHAPSDQGAAQVQAVVAQQQIVVAHEWIGDPAEADSRAQQARARLKVCDGDEPPAGDPPGFALSACARALQPCLSPRTEVPPGPALAAILTLLG